MNGSRSGEGPFLRGGFTRSLKVQPLRRIAGDCEPGGSGKVAVLRPSAHSADGLALRAGGIRLRVQHSKSSALNYGRSRHGPFNFNVAENPDRCHVAFSWAKSFHVHLLSSDTADNRRRQDRGSSTRYPGASRLWRKQLVSRDGDSA